MAKNTKSESVSASPQTSDGEEDVGLETPPALGEQGASRQAGQRETILSLDRKHRYVLWREWDNGALFTPKQIVRQFEYVMFIGLNPSTADESANDPTIRKCIGFAKRWLFGAICMTNLFSWRATDPKQMLSVSEPTDSHNDYWLRESAANATRIIAAWGGKGRHRARSSQLLQLLDPVDRNRLECLRVLKDGSPEHPLYVPYDITLQPWPPPDFQKHQG